MPKSAGPQGRGAVKHRRGDHVPGRRTTPKVMLPVPPTPEPRTPGRPNHLTGSVRSRREAIVPADSRGRRLRAVPQGRQRWARWATPYTRLRPPSAATRASADHPCGATARRTTAQRPRSRRAVRTGTTAAQPRAHRTSANASCRARADRNASRAHGRQDRATRPGPGGRATRLAAPAPNAPRGHRDRTTTMHRRTFSCGCDPTAATVFPHGLDRRSDGGQAACAD